MFKNYFLVTIRNLLKNRVYSFINVAGLSIGICCSILILLWVFDETSYDSFIPKSDRLYQLMVNAEFDGKVNSWNSVPLPTYQAMKDADVNIKNAVVTNWGGEHLLNVDENPIMKEGYYVGEEFLEMFEFPLLYGDAASVLDDASAIVITESTAKALFGDEDPINQIIRVDDKSDLKVSGILKDVPSNSSFEFDFLIPYSQWRQASPWVVENEDNWGNYSFQVFLELNDPANEEAVESSIKNILIEHGEEDLKPELFLHPMLRWRLHSEFENGLEKGGMIDYVNLFTIIAVFILIIACINFMNLATARSERRAREVGIRKSVGSRRIDLMGQFLGESIFISLMAFVIAILLAQLLLPLYNDLVEKELAINYTSGLFWLCSMSIILLTGLIAGSYPAFYLSSFQPVKVLKGKVKVGKKASTPRKVLVTLQFGFSILLIIGTIVIYEQIQLVKGRQLGYDQTNLITVDFTEEIGKNYDVLKQELLQSGAVEAVTRSNSSITQINSNNFVGWPGKPEDQRVIFTTIATEYDYAETMGIKVLMGRDFSRDFVSDTSAIVINKAALEIMGLEEPIGTQLDLWGDKRTLIGVVDDVMMGSPYQEVKPMFMILDPDWTNAVSIRLTKGRALEASLAEVKDIFSQYNAAYPFEYTFVDEEFQKKFTTINLTSKLANLFAILTIIITGLGLFGLASYTAEQRTKEIGIRKVLGASVLSIVSIMSKDFSRLVIISFLVSAPIAWWLLNMYLERYPIRTEVAWWIFPITGLFALTFALIVVTTQSLKAAQANPVNSLRSE
ncbi:putative ABC transport system permease protein [Catalinimonas alkaloidigena]|uniref:ABC transporter permease n=1 Tax=Catalinimonas alkaloidigena TaxID=1075417 RepID=UPI00240703BB|nr:ABC transporter permease [Catalinimonas alkaloidigena]MDF9799007.1 putative ABC transport system permease protein [Catalinimonas alkaloidigena]